MHRIPKLFTSNKPKQMDSKSQPSTPTTTTKRKLVRKNASNNINYHATSASTSAPASAATSAYTPDEESLTIRNRSIDVYPWGDDDRTSFRISGREGELERLFVSLGLNGPDEFGIDPGEFQAMKVKSGGFSGNVGVGGVDGEVCGGIEVLDGFRGGGSVVLGFDRSSEYGVGGSGIEVLDDRRVGSVVLGVERGDEYGVNEVCDGIEVLDDSRVRSGIFGVGRSNEYEVAGSVGVSSVILGVDRSREFDVDGKLCVGGEVLDDSRVSSVYLGIDQSNEFDVKLRDGVLEDGELCSEVVKKVVLSGGRSVGVGIRGERPPAVLVLPPPAVLVLPPPSMSLPVVDDACATSWEILRSFGPEDGMMLRIEGENDGASSEEERECDSQGDGIEGDGNVVRRLKSTNSNDDDTSSTTTDPMSISPNGILRRRITSWEKGKKLGSGSFGTVYEGIADGGFFFAVKEVSLLDQGGRGREIIYQFEQEMAFLRQFEHKNIVRYLDTAKRFRLQDSHVSVYTRQILEGLKYLHERSVVHRDIKCANILLDVDGNAKLADFGLAKVDKLNDAKSCKGTAYWMAPEVVKPDKGYGCPADIWSLGCTVLEMLTQNFPYHPLNGFQAMFQIGNGLPPPVPNSLSRDARDFILKCLQVNPETRPTAAELLEHPFVKKPHPPSTSPHHHGMQA